MTSVKITDGLVGAAYAARSALQVGGVAGAERVTESVVAAKPCACVNVDVGSYDNQVTVEIPEHMKEYRRLCDMEVMLICLDRCISDEVQTLWARGITTNGCCCGHGKFGAWIGVEPASVSSMEALGYEHYVDCSYPEYHFTSKSVAWAK